MDTIKRLIVVLYLDIVYYILLGSFGKDTRPKDRLGHPHLQAPFFHNFHLHLYFHIIDS